MKDFVYGIQKSIYSYRERSRTADVRWRRNFKLGHYSLGRRWIKLCKWIYFRFRRDVGFDWQYVATTRAEPEDVRTTTTTTTWRRSDDRFQCVLCPPRYTSMRALVICEMQNAKVRNRLRKSLWLVGMYRNKTGNNLRYRHRDTVIGLGLGSVLISIHSDQSQRFSQPVSQITIRTFAFRISQITHAHDSDTKTHHDTFISKYIYRNNNDLYALSHS